MASFKGKWEKTIRCVFSQSATNGQGILYIFPYKMIKQLLGNETKIAQKSRKVIFVLKIGHFAPTSRPENVLRCEKKGALY